MLPGATVVVTSNATGTKSEAITNDSGAYSVPALSAGVYTVTVSLTGFKTSVINDVRVQLGVPTTLNATLGVGASGGNHHRQRRGRRADQHADAGRDGDAQRRSDCA